MPKIKNKNNSALLSISLLLASRGSALLRSSWLGCQVFTNPTSWRVFGLGQKWVHLQLNSTWTLLWVLLPALCKESQACPGHPVCLRDLWKVSLRHLIQSLHWLQVVQGLIPCNELIQSASKRPNVRSISIRFCLNNLWSHVVRSSDNRALSSLHFHNMSGNAKIRDFNYPINCDKHVRWLEITMNDAVRVEELETSHRLGNDGGNDWLRPSTRRVDRVSKSVRNVLHNNVHFLGFGVVRVTKRSHNVR